MEPCVMKWKLNRVLATVSGVSLILRTMIDSLEFGDDFRNVSRATRYLKDAATFLEEFYEDLWEDEE